MAFVGMVYALHVDDDAQHMSALTYAGAALGVTFAGDLITLFLFWELMAISSTLLIWTRRNRSAIAAGYRYLLVHVFGGLLLLAGIAISLVETGTVIFDNMGSSPKRQVPRLDADPRRLFDQRGRPAAGGLASRCLPGSHGHGRGLS